MSVSDHSRKPGGFTGLFFAALIACILACGPPTTEELIMAATVGDLEKIESLINSGVDVNGRDEWGQTALWWAAQQGDIDIAHLLLDSGADANVINMFQTSVMQAAVGEGHDDVVGLLLDRAPVELNTVDANGNTALMSAVKKGSAGIVQKLLGGGADVNALIGDQSALTMAIENQNSEVARLLLQNGAKVDHVDGNGKDFLVKAASEGNPALAKLLQGTDIGSASKQPGFAELLKETGVSQGGNSNNINPQDLIKQLQGNK